MNKINSSHLFQACVILKSVANNRWLLNPKMSCCMSMLKCIFTCEPLKYNYMSLTWPNVTINVSFLSADSLTHFKVSLHVMCISANLHFLLIYSLALAKCLFGWHLIWLTILEMRPTLHPSLKPCSRQASSITS